MFGGGISRIEAWFDRNEQSRLWLLDQFSGFYFHFIVNSRFRILELSMIILMQVRDFRGGSPEQGPGAQSTDGLPTVSKIHLRMSLENVVKDIPLISDNSWTYGDLMVCMISS